ncbi:LamG-like jellyroll fold domain-containing protein [Vallicoccus soli]|uniref:LamG-like jellyroll fold domain-containing protein n=1 Tax=Vallicoccus soli TaxID=2339232 RepID=A0A3A3Z9Z8_9ACTN|nr:LamG-like jellyroll fold domain-containing protein [Vallicoccus soli]RJK97916.1 hypothetical protein D5H78_02815 [Vallicoccus soli]
MARRKGALVLALALTLPLSATAGLPAGPAAADTAPAAGVPETLTADPQPTWQTNGVVWATEIVGDVVYVGGSFTAVRPPGAAPGAQEVPRRNLAAFDKRTGALLPFAHDVRAPESTATTDITCQPGTAPGTRTCDTVYEIQASPDGSRLYVGGDFATVDGKPRDKVAAFLTATGALDTVFKPPVYGRVRAIAVTDSTVYVGGHFTSVWPSTPRQRLAAYARSTGALLPWAPTADRPVLAMAMAPDGSRVVLGGQFDRVNGVDIHGLAAVDATTGESTRWDSRPIPKVSDTRYSYVTDLVVDEDTVYASSNGEGTFDGRVAADPYTGQLRWVDSCLGATWSLALVRGLLYSGSHAHNCSSTPGGFPEAYNGILPENQRYYRLLAQDARGGTTEIRHWFPTTNGGIQGKLGPRTMASDADHLWVGGEFTTVNGVAQQGLTRFTFHGVSPDVGRPRTPAAVRASTSVPGQVVVHAFGTEDLDNEQLVYELIRDHDTARPLQRWEAGSRPWAYPQFTYVDTDVAPGSTHTYDLRATDPWGNRSYRSWEVRATVASERGAYARNVLGAVPGAYWRLSEASGSTAADASTGGVPGAYGSGVARGVASAVASEPGDGAASFDGTSRGVVRATRKMAGPQHFSLELWFRTTTTRGGKLVGFGTSASTTGGTSGSYDRHVYMNGAGQLLFGAYPGSAVVVKSPGSYRDGAWHHLAATMGAGGMRLYVDGQQVAAGPSRAAQPYEGYWGLGGDSLGGWPERPASDFFAGQLDDFSYYPFELTPEEVAAHRASATP